MVELKTVAREARVSVAAASIALFNDGRDAKTKYRRVSAGTQERVVQAARQLGYVPHQAARSLRMGKTHTIALVSSAGLRHPHVNELLEQIQLELTRHRYNPILEFAYLPTGERTTIAPLAPGRCDGVVRLGLDPRTRPEMVALRERGLPVVVYQPWPDPDFDTIGPDRREDGRLAARHLLAQGHRTTAAVVGPEEIGKAGDRVAEYRQVLQAAGAAAPLVLHVPVEGDAKALWEQIKSARPRPTAVFVSNDELAVQLVQAIHRDGSRVPEDLAVVAIGLTWIGRFSEVPITNVDQNRAELARVVVARLLERMEHPAAPPQHILVKPFLVERESSQKPR